MSYLPTASELIDRAIAESREMSDEIERLTALTEGDPTSVYHELAEARREIDRLTAERDEAREHAEWQRDRWQEHIGRFDITSRNQPFPWEQP